MFNPQNDNYLMMVLKCNDVTHPLLKTSRGELALLLRKGETEYTFTLDSVPVSSDEQKELKKIFLTEE